MIDPKELRIGNLVRKNEFRHEISWIDFHCLHSEPQSPQYNPILITPEWLERLGFEKINHISEGVIYKKEWLRLNDKCMVIDWRSGGIDCRLIKSIHQLQNLYFALTGTELQIKQP